VSVSRDISNWAVGHFLNEQQAGTIPARNLTTDAAEE
jgi:hypothetical protein